MSSKARSCPIVEAVCEFRFDPLSPWDITIPGLIFSKLEGTFSKKRQKRLMASEMAEGPNGAPVQNVNIVERVQMLTEDEKSLVQVNRNFLSVNQLAPYTSWEAYSPLIEKSLDVYRNVASPSGLQYIGLRYINRVLLPKNITNLGDYFNFYLAIKGSLPHNYTQFMCSNLVPRDNNGFLNFQLSSGAASDNLLPIILDLSCFSESIKIDDAMDWIVTAHDDLDAVFRGCLTDKAREIVQEVAEC